MQIPFEVENSMFKSYCVTKFDRLLFIQERAANNNTFLYIKVPQVPLRVSYKVSYGISLLFLKWIRFCLSLT